LALAIIIACRAQAGPIKPFFDTTNDAPIEKITEVADRQNSLEAKPGVPIYFQIDHRPRDSFPVLNDTGYIITDLHLRIFDPGKYTIANRPIPGVGITVTPDPNGAFTQPDASWDMGTSNIFDKIERSNNNRTVDFTEPKKGTKGIEKNAVFVDGKEVPANTTLPILVESSFSVPAADAKSSGKSVTYDATNSTLTFSNDIITDTGDPNDPVIGSEVSPPSFRKVGVVGSTVTFLSTSPSLFTIHNGSTTYLTGELSALTYSIPDNSFSGTVIPIAIAGVEPGSTFFNSAFPDVASAFLGGIDEYMNPDSTLFSPSSRLSYSSQPSVDFFALTNGFSTSAEAPLTNSVFISTPEPSTLTVLGIGTLGLLGYGCRRRKQSA
jgi:hypothetical protein